MVLDGIELLRWVSWYFDLALFSTTTSLQLCLFLPLSLGFVSSLWSECRCSSLYFTKFSASHELYPSLIYSTFVVNLINLRMECGYHYFCPGALMLDYALLSTNWAFVCCVLMASTLCVCVGMIIIVQWAERLSHTPATSKSTLTFLKILLF